MFAVVRASGKQYHVSKDDIIIIDKIDNKSGEKLNLNEVLIVGDGDNILTGSPLVAGAQVKTEIIEHRKNNTVTVFKKTRRHNYRRKQGHRQNQTVLKVIDIIGIKRTKSKSSNTVKKDNEEKSTNIKKKVPKTEKNTTKE